MKTQLFSSGRVLGFGIAAASAAFLGTAVNNAEAVPYSGTNAINFMFTAVGEASYTAATNLAEGIDNYADPAGTAQGEVPLGADPMNNGATWNQYIPGSAAVGGPSSGSYSLTENTNFTSTASYANTTGLVDSQGNATDIVFTTPVGANFQNASWPDPVLSTTNEYAYSATPREEQLRSPPRSRIRLAA